MKTLLVTGGAGYIGSHTCLVLLLAGYRIIVLDNFSNSSPEGLRRVQELAGPSFQNNLRLIEGDIRSSTDLDAVFSLGINAVIHFAGLKAVAESVSEPLSYWDINVCGSHHMLSKMQQYGCRTIVFSSSATVYGMPVRMPIKETEELRPISPYGNTKAVVEQLLADLFNSESGWRIACLRYFNPVGAHPSGRIGEDPRGIPTNLFPLLCQVAAGHRPILKIFGSDWPTCDGSGVRDYIHVMDLAEGHQAALDVLLAEPSQLLTLNLGSGQGHSVIQVLKIFEELTGSPLPHEIVDRRPGDVAVSVADSLQALQRLGWQTKRSLLEMCRDSLMWQSANPCGYNSVKSS